MKQQPWWRRLLRRALRYDRKTVRDVAAAVILERANPIPVADLRDAIERGLKASKSWNEETERQLDRWLRDYHDEHRWPKTAGWADW